MIAHFNDFSLCVYVLVDAMCKELKGHLGRPAPKPECSDSELNRYHNLTVSSYFSNSLQVVEAH